MGLLDSFNLPSDNQGMSPLSQGLLAAGLGILANNRGLTSGGQALGIGGMQGLQQYGAARQSQMQQQLQNAQLQQLGFGLQKNKMLLDMARGYLGGDQPQGAPAAPAAPALDAGGLPAGPDGSGPGVQSTPVPMGAGGPPGGGGAPPMQPPPQMPMPQGTPPQGGQSAVPNSPFGNMPGGLVAYGLMTDPGKLFENAAAQYSPTDLQKTMRAAGIDVNSDLGRQILRQNIAKTNNIPLVAGRAGAPMFDQSGRIVAMAPKIPDNAIPQVVNGQVVGVSPLSGAANVEQINSYANAAGKAQTKPYAGVDRNGNPVPVTNELAAASGGTTPASQAIVQTESGGNPNAVSPKGAHGAWQVMPNTKTNPGFGVQPAQNNSPAELDRVGKDYYNSMTQRYGSPTLGAIAYNMGPGATDSWIKSGAQFEKLPAETRNYVGKVSTLTALNGMPPSAPQQSAQPIYAAAPMGAQANATAAADAQQAELSKSWSAQNDANTQAQTTASYLQQIKALAPKAATGPMSDRLNYVNGLLSLAGSQKATDAVTANSLLDKYSNQIVARLGSGGMGTDAARSILASAYPGAHMNVDAINEASDNLVGASNMTQARQRILQPLANKRDPVAFNEAATNFDTNADPRIFQYANIQDLTARAAFAKNLMKQDPKIGDKIKALHDMGAF